MLVLVIIFHWFCTKTRVKFAGRYLKHVTVTFNHGKVVNLHCLWDNVDLNDNNNHPTIENVLFGVVSLTKNADINKYKYSEYGIGFDRRSNFSFSDGRICQNVIIFRVDMSSSTEIDNREKDILILGKGSMQGLEHTLSAEKMYSINFSKGIQSLV